MSNDASWNQAAHILSLFSEKRTSREQVQKLVKSGLLADLLVSNIDQVDRDQFRRVLGLSGVDLLVQVDRSRFYHEPESDGTLDLKWVNDPEFRRLEATGPTEYRMRQVKKWLHPKQQKGEYVVGQEVYDLLKERQMLERSFGIADLVAIQKLGPVFYEYHFRHETVCAWKSAVSHTSWIAVPCLFWNDGLVAWDWCTLKANFSPKDYVYTIDI